MGYQEPEALLRSAEIEAERGEVFFEFCLEFLDDPQEGPGIIRQFLAVVPDAWVVVTCRRGEHNFYGTLEEQLAILEASIEAGARMIDVEIESARQACEWMEAMGHRAARIVSYHNFRGCPPLDSIMHELESIPADIIKVAVRAESSDTLYQLMTAGWECRKQNLMLAMGKEGLSSRIVSPILGRSFTYATPLGHEGTGEGQPDAATLRTQLTTCTYEEIVAW